MLSRIGRRIVSCIAIFLTPFIVLLIPFVVLVILLIIISGVDTPSMDV